MSSLQDEMTQLGTICVVLLRFFRAMTGPDVGARAGRSERDEAAAGLFTLAAACLVDACTSHHTVGRARRVLTASAAMLLFWEAVLTRTESMLSFYDVDAAIIRVGFRRLWRQR